MSGWHRQHVIWIAAGLVVALQALPAAGPLLEYRRELLLAQPWRAVTGHVVHVNAVHAMINALAWCVLARLFAPEMTASRHAIVLAGAAIGISIGLAWVWPEIEWYRGLSGALHAVFFAGATLHLRHAWQATPRRIGWAGFCVLLLSGGAIKLWLEHPAAEQPHVQWLGAAAVPQAHLIGAVIGTALGAAFARRDRGSAPAPARQRAEESDQDQNPQLRRR